MPRLPRYEVPGHPQHVVQRGNNRCVTFSADDDYQHFRDWLSAAASRHGCQIHAYVLMTNHVHLLVTPMRTGSVALTMQSVGRRYVRYFNDIHERTGTLWEGRYRATLVDSEHYLLSCYRYIELNPVRAGLVTRPDEYRWSSHSTNAWGAADPLIAAHPCYEALGAEPRARLKAYRALFRSAADERVLHDIREATNTGWALGDERFRENITALSHRRAGPLPRGRPRSTEQAAGAPARRRRAGAGASVGPTNPVAPSIIRV